MRYPRHLLKFLFALLTTLITTGCDRFPGPENPTTSASLAPENAALQRVRAEHFQQDLREHWERASRLFPRTEESGKTIAKGLLWVSEVGAIGASSTVCSLLAWHHLALDATLDSLVLAGLVSEQEPPLGWRELPLTTIGEP